MIFDITISSEKVVIQGLDLASVAAAQAASFNNPLTSDVVFRFPVRKSGGEDQFRYLFARKKPLELRSPYFKTSRAIRKVFSPPKLTTYSFLVFASGFLESEKAVVAPEEVMDKSLEGSTEEKETKLVQEKSELEKDPELGSVFSDDDDSDVDDEMLPDEVCLTLPYVSSHHPEVRHWVVFIEDVPDCSTSMAQVTIREAEYILLCVLLKHALICHQ